MTTGSVWALPPRAPGLIMEEVGDEIVVVDPDTQRAHALSGLAARVFVASEDGRFTGEDDPAAVDAAVAGLVEAGLLVPTVGISRRVLLQRAGVVAAAAGIITIGLPTAANAASTPTVVIFTTTGSHTLNVPANTT
ncbi:MAG: twin-arginine translocation signal domain-containing protein, partial [Mycobacteriaceae bacterium]